MLCGTSILIVEDAAIIAFGLAIAVKEANGIVIGPTPTVKQALILVEQHHLAGAILDANLADRDVTPLALELYKRDIPFILHSAIGPPLELISALPNLLIVMKPTAPDEVINAVIQVINQFHSPK